MVGTGGAKPGSFSRNLAAVTPTAHAQAVASSDVPTMAVGCLAPLAAKSAMAVVGRSCTELVLIARNVHMAFVAVPGARLSVSRSAMARRPRGVAALPRPSMLEAMFITIDPIAGWSPGTSGKSRRNRGRKPRARINTRPDFSASRMIPSQMHIGPTSGRATFITAVFAPSNAPTVTASSWLFQPPSTTETTISASQM